MVQDTTPSACGIWGIGDCVWGDPVPRTTTAWQGDSVTMITGMCISAARTSSSQVRQALTGAGSTILAAQNYVRHEETSRLRAHSFFAGVTGRAARISGEFQLMNVSGTSSVQLLRRDQAMCYLTHLSGSFSGAQNSASIKADGDRWRLWVSGTTRPRCRPARAA